MWWLAALVIGALVLDRLLLRAERKGLIYYRHRKPSSGSASAAAFGPVVDALRPGQQIVVEQKLQEQTKRRQAQAGEGHGDLPFRS